MKNIYYTLCGLFLICMVSGCTDPAIKAVKNNYYEKFDSTQTFEDTLLANRNVSNIKWSVEKKPNDRSVVFLRFKYGTIDKSARNLKFEPPFRPQLDAIDLAILQCSVGMAEAQITFIVDEKNGEYFVKTVSLAEVYIPNENIEPFKNIIKDMGVPFFDEYNFNTVWPQPTEEIIKLIYYPRSRGNLSRVPSCIYSVYTSDAFEASEIGRKEFDHVRSTVKKVGRGYGGALNREDVDAIVPQAGEFSNAPSRYRTHQLEERLVAINTELRNSPSKSRQEQLEKQRNDITEELEKRRKQGE